MLVITSILWIHFDRMLEGLNFELQVHKQGLGQTQEAAWEAQHMHACQM